MEFEGNSFATDGQLKTKVKTKPGFAYIFKGYHDEQGIEGDKMALTDYYRRFGFFQASVSPIVEWNDDDKWATVRWIVSEGPQSSVRNISLMGNELFATKDLQAGLKLQGAQTFERDKLSGDVEWLKELYGSRGYVFADIKADVRYLDEPGKVDLVYTVDEGKQFRVGRIFVNIGGESPHTKITTALNRLSIKPGQIMDIREVRASERRLQASSLFHADATRNVYPKITFKIPEVEEDILTASSQPVSRGQSPEEPRQPRCRGSQVCTKSNARTPRRRAGWRHGRDVGIRSDMTPVAPPTAPEPGRAQPLPADARTPLRRIRFASHRSMRSGSLQLRAAGERTRRIKTFEWTRRIPTSRSPSCSSMAAATTISVIRGQNPSIGWTSGSTPTPARCDDRRPNMAPNMAGQVAQAASAPYGQPAPINDPNVRPAQFASPTSAAPDLPAYHVAAWYAVASDASDLALPSAGADCPRRERHARWRSAGRGRVRRSRRNTDRPLPGGRRRELERRRRRSDLARRAELRLASLADQLARRGRWHRVAWCWSADATRSRARVPKCNATWLASRNRS